MPEITKSGTIIRSNEECALTEEDLNKFHKLLVLAKAGKIKGIDLQTTVPFPMSEIFTVTGMQYTTIRTNRNGQEYEYNDFHVIGWFHTFENAEHAILNNIGDMYEEGEYPCVIIEKVSYGVMPEVWDSTWYEWNEEADGYIKCDKPAKYAHVVGFSIG